MLNSEQSWIKVNTVIAQINSQILAVSSTYDISLLQLETCGDFWEAEYI